MTHELHPADLMVDQPLWIRAGLYLGHTLEQRFQKDKYIPLATEVKGLCQFSVGVGGLVMAVWHKAIEIRRGTKLDGFSSPAFVLDMSSGCCYEGLKNVFSLPTVFTLGYVAGRFFNHTY